MKKNRLWFLFSVWVSICFLAGSYSCQNTSKQAGCPAWGREKPDATRPLTDREKDLNKGKNRPPVADPGTQPEYIDLARILHEPVHHDRDDLEQGKLVAADCFIVKYTEEGPESCNCYEADKTAHDGDVHIYIADIPEAEGSECMIAEITPEFKKLHPNYVQLLKTGAKVRITGYLLYDYMHEKNSTNCCIHCDQGIWRKTCWELHPVVSVE